jgi:hypothetical protein
MGRDAALRWLDEQAHQFSSWIAAGAANAPPNADALLSQIQLLPSWVRLPLLSSTSVALWLLVLDSVRTISHASFFATL